MALFDEITHCYRRNPRKDGNIIIYTMVHAFDEKSCYTIVEKISKAVDVTEYSLLFSRKELKKYPWHILIEFRHSSHTLRKSLDS